MLNNKYEDDIKFILRILQKNRKIRSDEDYSMEPYKDAIRKIVESESTFKMFLSCFHCKSINQNSVFGKNPDGAEEIAIKTLEKTML